MISPHEIIRRLRRSEVEWERTAFYAGRVVADGSPYLMPLDSFLEHGGLIGPPGTGKTAMIRNLSWQLKGMRVKHSQVINNGKAFGADLQHEAMRDTTRKKRWMTNRLGRSTYVMNPFDQPWYKELSHLQSGDFWMSALNLSYGTFYGASHYTDGNAAVIDEGVWRKPASLQELKETLIDVVRTNSKDGALMKETKAAGSHVVAITQRLKRMPCLNQPSTFDLSDLYREPTDLLIDSPLTIGPETNRYMTNIVMSSLAPAAMVVRPSERIPIVWFGDEAARYVGRNTGLLVQQFRELGALILGFQSYDDIRAEDRAVASSIENNCNFEWSFGARTAQEIQRLIDISGETVEIERSAEYFRGRREPVRRESNAFLAGGRTAWIPAGERQSQREVILKRLNVNEIAAMTNHPRRSLIRERGGHHLGLPVVIEHFFHTSKGDFQKSLDDPWMEPNAETIIVRDEERSSTPVSVAPNPPQPNQDNVLRSKKQRR